MFLGESIMRFLIKFAAGRNDFILMPLGYDYKAVNNYIIRVRKYIIIMNSEKCVSN